MKNCLPLGLISMLMLGMTGIAIAQENARQPQDADSGASRDSRPRGRSIRRLDHLTKDLELTLRTSGNR